MYTSKRHQQYFLIFTSVIVILSTLIGCGPSPEDLAVVDYSPLPGDDFEVSTPEAEVLDPYIVAKVYYEAGQLDSLSS